MPIEIDGVKFLRVHRITTAEQAGIVYHSVPGQEGNVAQALGRDSVRLEIEGIFYGTKALQDLDHLRSIYMKRTGVDFIADILGSTYAGKVTLDRLDVLQAADEPDQFSYVLVVTEYVQPPPAAPGTAAIDANAKLDAKAMLDVASLPDALALGSLPEITNPIEPLKGALEPVQKASEAVSGSCAGLQQLLGI